MPTPHNPTVNDIIEKARRIRMAKHYSQDYMAAKLKISQNAYSKMEQGLTRIPVPRLFKLAELLEIDIAILLSKDGLEKSALKVIRLK